MSRDGRVARYTNGDRAVSIGYGTACIESGPDEGSVSGFVHFTGFAAGRHSEYMSYWDAQSPDLQELAALPPGDPRRREFEANLSMASPAERLYWSSVLRETDRLYSEMQHVQVPSGLQDRLLQIAAPQNQPIWKRWMNFPFDWRFLVGGLVTAAIVAGACFWFAEPSHPVALADSFAEQIANQAVHEHEQPPPLQVTGSDLKTVEAALNHGQVPFPVVVLQPAGKLDLQGGGACDMDGTPAVYTRWTSNGQLETLYQFDGRKIGIPARFYRRMEVPTSLWHDTHHYRVVIWPGDGGQCTWALVLESENAKDVFSRAVY
jgi:hypothetical protein